MLKLHHGIAVVTFGILYRLNRFFWGRKLVNLVFLRMQPIFGTFTGPINILETQITDKIAITSHS